VIGPDSSHLKRDQRKTDLSFQRFTYSAKMLEFMDFVQYTFYDASRWNYENSYSDLTATARGLQPIEFYISEG
jgi:hypothetical protein